MKNSTNTFGLSEYDTNVLIEDKEIALYFNKLCSYTKNYKAAANFVTGSIKSYLNENAININNFSINEERMAALIALVDDGKVSNSIATQKVFISMLNNEDSPEVIAKANNWIQESDNITLQEWIDAAVAKYPEKGDRI